MPFAVVYSQRAKRQIAAIGEWCRENRRPARPIGDELTWFIGLLQASPHLGNAVANARRPGLRHFYLWRIDYHLFYRVDERKAQVVIEALRHGHQRPVRI